QPKVEAPEPVNDQSCVIGQDTQISLEVSEIGKPQVPWFFNNKPLPTNDRFEVAHTEDGTSTLSIRQAEFGDKGVYTARATNAVGEAKAKTTLDIAGIKPTINTNLDATLYATNGETMILKITASGTPKPDIVWIRGNDELILTDRIKVAKPTGDDDAYTLSISNVQPEDQEEYSAQISNIGGSLQSNKCKVTVSSTSPGLFLFLSTYFIVESPLWVWVRVFCNLQ
ncbi:unnamed protein product, partial [Rotaria magnacalcarata]